MDGCCDNQGLNSESHMQHMLEDGFFMRSFLGVTDAGKEHHSHEQTIDMWKSILVKDIHMICFMIVDELPIRQRNQVCLHSLQLPFA